MASRRRRQGPNPAAAVTALNCYVNTVRDPWLHGPCRIGFGTMVPTQLVTGYVRQTVSANADGSLAIFMVPGVLNTITYDNGGAAVAAWTSASCTNSSAIQALASEFRIVSGGIRAIPQVPGTAAPGLAYVGSLPAATSIGMVANSPNTLIANPLLRMGYAASGASAVLLPVDPRSFEFGAEPGGGYATTQSYPVSTPVIVFTGLPASATVLIEGVINLEAIQSSSSISGALQNLGRSDEDQPTLADHFSSRDQLWNAARRMIPSAATVAEGFSHIASATVNAARAYSAYRSIRGQMFNAPAGANRLVIEEVA